MRGRKVEKTWSAYADRISIPIAQLGAGLRYLTLVEEGSSMVLV